MVPVVKATLSLYVPIGRLLGFLRDRLTRVRLDRTRKTFQSGKIVFLTDFSKYYAAFSLLDIPCLVTKNLPRLTTFRLPTLEKRFQGLAARDSNGASSSTIGVLMEEKDGVVMMRKKSFQEEK
ncbi:hypothetical protein HAX54_030289, partial [Datura stramonium]|nr:hypothetical protein [Datura stramonium]